MSPAQPFLPIPLDPPWHNAFLHWLTNHPSAQTRRAYLAAWRHFLAFRPIPPQHLTPADFLAYRHHLEQSPSPRTGQPCQPATIQQRLAALSSFLRFAQQRGLRPDHPLTGLQRPAIAPYSRATWLDGETEQDIRLLQVVDTTTLQGKRDFALLLLFLTTALRVEAAASLPLAALRYQGRHVFLSYTNKGGETVEKRLEPLTVSAIEAYLHARAAETPLPPHAPLFAPTPRGQQAIAHLPHTDPAARAGHKPLSARAIHKLVKAYCDRAFGPGHGLSPHSLRHTAAMNAILEGASVTEVAQLLRHKSLRVTTVYLHATDRDGDRVSRRLGRRYARRLKASDDEEEADSP